MYTVSKGPSKFVAKSRIGIPPHLENGSWELKKSFDSSYNSSSEEFSNVVSDISKPVFLQINNKKLNSLRYPPEALTPEHEEIVKFVSENWSSVSCKTKQESAVKKGGVVAAYYRANEPNGQLKDFVPFDLDSWWGKRLYNTITKSVP